MTSLPVTQARSRLYQLLDEAADSHEPIQITGKRSNAVLVSEEIGAASKKRFISSRSRG